MRKQMNEMMKRAAMMIAAATMVIGLMAPVSVQAAETPAAQAAQTVAAQAAQTVVAGTAVVGEGGGIETGAANVSTQIMALQAVYPEGMLCTNESAYYFNPAAWSFYGMGCSAFAMQISDAVYGKTAPVSMLRGQTPDNIQAGDVVRIGGIHTVVVISVSADSITVCEGNFNSSVHWGRVITKASLEGQITYIARRA